LDFGRELLSSTQIPESKFQWQRTAFMCRSIKRLREREVMASEEEIRAAALQFVRKVSGFSKPTKAHEEAFAVAVDEIAASSQRLLEAVIAQLSAAR